MIHLVDKQITGKYLVISTYEYVGKSEWCYVKIYKKPSCLYRLMLWLKAEDPKEPIFSQYFDNGFYESTIREEFTLAVQDPESYMMTHML